MCGRWASSTRAGQSAAYTGKNCVPWAGHIIGKNFAVQGNMLVGEPTVKAMAEAFQRHEGCRPA